MTLEEYMEELYLMDKQYGQEEELYPLINILLRQSGSVAGLSLRDVHNGAKAEGEKNRELLKGLSGFPDLVVLDKKFGDKNNDDNAKYIYGCVEAKTRKKFKPLDEKMFKGKLNVKKMHKLLMKFSNDKHFDYYRYFDNVFNSININGEKKKWTDKDELIEYNNFGEIDKVKVEEYNIEKLTGAKTKSVVVLKEIFKGKSYVAFKKLDDIYVVFNNKERIEIDSQLFGQIVSFGNVIYTDGKTWHLYKRRECQELKDGYDGYTIKISHEKIGDLKCIYERYNGYKDEINNKNRAEDKNKSVIYNILNNDISFEFKPEDYSVWKKLLSNLATIEWNKNLK